MESTEVDQHAARMKAVMMKSSSESGLNLYDHLVKVLLKVMDEEPYNAVDVIEEVSRTVKLCSFEEKQSTLRDLPQPTPAELLAEQQRQLFTVSDEADQEDELEDSAVPNVSELAFFLEQAGVGLGREEMHRIFLALKQLVQSEALLHCRLWGKILGTTSNYIIAEAEIREGMEEDEEEVEEEQSDESVLEEEQKDDENQPKFKPPPVVPTEPLGTGTNKFIYYVCNEPGLPWVKLPAVTPAQITTARKIRKFFTGRLDTPIVSYPPFPGNEANYLRAQIARISAGTHSSPQGYYQLRDEEEDEALRDTCEVNPDFEPIPVAELAESLSEWVHHVQHILQQGRCTWVNVTQKLDHDSIEEEESDESEEEADEPEGEVGPPLLTPLSEDEERFGTPPWSIRLSSRLTAQHAVAVLRSNLWPGAVAFACGRKFENFYVGWGLKYAGEGHSPVLPPLPQSEFPSGPEISETVDPSVEQEQSVQEALEEQEAAREEMEESDEDEEDDD